LAAVHDQLVVDVLGRRSAHLVEVLALAWAGDGPPTLVPRTARHGPSGWRLDP
jgi:hypothetical protein